MLGAALAGADGCENDWDSATACLQLEASAAGPATISPGQDWGWRNLQVEREPIDMPGTVQHFNMHVLIILILGTLQPRH